MAAMADRRADLDPHIGLLAEHEIAKLVRLVSEIVRRMDIEQSEDPELEELKEDVAPEKVLETMEHQETGKRKEDE